jgi:hypothetical protein
MSGRPKTDDRRKFSRVGLALPVQLEVPPARQSCVLRDVSLKGALVEVPAGLVVEVDQPVTRVLSLEAEGVTIRMQGKVAHRHDNLVGVRCGSIDLESIMHLRRLLELNLGDGELVSRELRELVDFDKR